MLTASPASDTDNGKKLCVLIEGPRWGDAEFYGRWLLASAQVDRIWKDLIVNDATFRDRTLALDAIVCLDFGLNCTIIISKLAEKYRTAVIEPDGYDAEAVWMLTQLGFFTQTGDRYQMTIPGELQTDRVKQVLLALADQRHVKCREVEAWYDTFGRERECRSLSPFFLQCVPRSQAAGWQQVLDSMEETERLAHRSLLLAVSGNRESRESKQDRVGEQTVISWTKSQVPGERPDESHAAP